MDLKVGDVVVLKSGGPKMTIKRIETVKLLDSDNNTIMGHCNWFEKEQLQSKMFPLETLVLFHDN